MRPSNRRAAALVLATVSVTALAAPAVADRAAEPERRSAKEVAVPFGSSCRTAVQGSRVVAYCHNPYPETDLVRLHIECDRWWDIDTDAAPVEVGPAQTVRLTDRCWKEVRMAWVSHHRI
ncbi:hypothetical protein [Streptomyces hypolithicus]